MPEQDPALTARFRKSGVSLLALADGGAVPDSFGDPLAEHLATRDACGLFDFSFMGGWEISGHNAAAHLTRLQTRDLGALAPGQVAYTLMCRQDGTIYNDATVWKFSKELYWLFSGRKSDAQWIAHALPPSGVSLHRIDNSLAVLALQGPNSGRLLASMLGEEPVCALSYFRFTETVLAGEEITLARLGYSGEVGYEIVLPAPRAPALWRALLEAGEPFGLRECGFGAANSLRIESGYLLFSAELVRPRLPAEVRLERLVASRQQDPEDPAAIARAPSRSTLVCLELEEAKDSGAAGSVELTSRAFSPLAGKTLALGFADPAHAAQGTLLRAEDGAVGTVCSLPWYDPGRLRPKADPLGSS